MENALSTQNRLDRYFKDYASYHRTPGNKFCHYTGIPMIMLSLLGLLSAWVLIGETSSFIRLDGGIVLLLLATVWYLVLDWKLAIPFTLAAAGVYLIGRSLPTAALWGLFVGGWIVQFIGHYKYEKKSPAFFKNIEHLLIGPLWVFARIFHYRVS